jgi:acyl-CoA thioesterase-1
VVVGDSLSSGYGLDGEPSWVALLSSRLEQQGYGHDVVNASIAGDTSAGGLARLPRLLDTYAPSILVIELGGNDGLRGQPLTNLHDNLARMIELAQAHGAEVMLAGIRLPPNYGQAYTEALSALYPDLANMYGIPLIGFFLEGVALKAEYMQADGIHPNAAGQAILLDNVWSALSSLL